MIAQPFGPCAGVALEQLMEDLLCVGHHGAELQTFEGLAALTDAAVAQEDGSVRKAHAYGDDQDEG